MSSLLEFRCNVCGTPSAAEREALQRELPSCGLCGSTVRFRAVAHLVARSLTGASVALPELPLRKDLVGLGLSDWDGYARLLAERLSYTNTFFHAEPRLDITAPPVELAGTCDFVVATEVLEHVPPPVRRGFDGLRRLLKPGGLAIITVPYAPAGETVEHFPALDRWRLVEANGSWRLENVTAEGRFEVYDDLTFHGGDGVTLEMRVFSRDGLLGELHAAGFEDVQIESDEVPEFGIVWHESWSLPVTARAPRARAERHAARRARPAPTALESPARPAPRRSSVMRVSFVIPAFNEASTIRELLDRVDALEFDKQIVVVDDGSGDGTGDLASQWAAGRADTLVVRQPNAGKGAAIRAAMPHVDGDVVVIQDADLEYDPADVPQLIEPIVRGHADVVFGSRLSGGRPQRAYLFWHLVGNRVLSLLTNVLYNTTLSDMETGYKAFRAEVFRELQLTEDGFGVEPEITGKVCRRNLRVYELPIAYYGRTYAEGKKITWRDGVRAIWVLLRVRATGR